MYRVAKLLIHRIITDEYAMENHPVPIPLGKFATRTINNFLNAASPKDFTQKLSPAIFNSQALLVLVAMGFHLFPFRTQKLSP